MQPPADVYRVARKPDPWSFLNWIWAHDDGTFGNRYDDPQRTYRVLYASSQRFGCFVETLACYRIDPLLAAEMAEISGEPDYYPAGKVPEDWLTTRAMGTATVHADCADIFSSEWIDRLRTKVLPRLRDFALKDMDTSVLQSSSDRRVTQLVSRIAYESGFTGVRYPSKFGHDIENWAFFEPVTIGAKRSEALRADDPDLVRALQHHHLTF